MKLPEYAICKYYYKVDWCISAHMGQRMRIHDWNDVAVQLSFAGTLIWVDMADFNEFFELEQNNMEGNL